MGEHVEVGMVATAKTRRKWKEIRAWGLWPLDDGSSRNCLGFS